MDQFGGKSTSWDEQDPVVTEVVEEGSTLTIATTVGVTLVVLVAIVAVFLLGIFIDCRQQRVLRTKMEESQRMKNQRRVTTHLEDYNASIVNNIEEVAMSEPPANNIIRNIP